MIFVEKMLRKQLQVLNYRRKRSEKIASNLILLFSLSPDSSLLKIIT